MKNPRTNPPPTAPNSPRRTHTSPARKYSHGPHMSRAGVRGRAGEVERAGRQGEERGGAGGQGGRRAGEGDEENKPEQEALGLVLAPAPTLAVELVLAHALELAVKLALD